MKDHPITNNHSPKKKPYPVYVNSKFRTMGFLIALSNKALRVYAALSSYKNNESGNCYPTIEKLSNDTKLNRSSVIKAVQELEKLTLIKAWKNRKEGFRFFKKIYHINDFRDISPLNMEKYKGFRGSFSMKQYPRKRDKKGRFLPFNSIKDGISKSIEHGISSSIQHGISNSIKDGHITTLNNFSNKTTLNNANKNIMDKDSFKKEVELLFKRIK
ncbi:MAG: helix-turn-helix domain-containing protein [Candidatus Hodarchaeota archaeon]